uniref:Uncharacterized protein n=1 Tax=Leptospirillum ferrodiazotrophum TaxID=412449 RepID=C6HTU3_9BACT|nr:MAG: hypothetical protein UBAL3_44810009 [Leptospirillum ferrodiazotrophum]
MWIKNIIFGKKSLRANDRKNPENCSHRSFRNHKLPPFRTLKLSALLLSFLVPGCTNPGLHLANAQDSFAQDPFVYSEISSSRSEPLKVFSDTLYASRQVELRTTVYLPSSALRKIGMDHVEGWDYEARTVNAPLYPSKKGGDRSVVTEIEIIAFPNAKRSDLVVLDEKNRVFLLHLVPHPKTVGDKPFYSRDVSWWPATGSFSSEGLWPLGNNSPQHSSHPTKNGKGNHVR